MEPELSSPQLPLSLLVRRAEALCPLSTRRTFPFFPLLQFRVNLDRFLSLCIPWEKKKKKTQIIEAFLSSQGSSVPLLALGEGLLVPRSQPGAGGPAPAVGQHREELGSQGQRWAPARL